MFQGSAVCSWQVYGKGKAADCRKHVQKLNMMRGEREQADIHARLSSNHPPEDYASTFTINQCSTAEETVSELASLYQCSSVHLVFVVVMVTV